MAEVNMSRILDTVTLPCHLRHTRTMLLEIDTLEFDITHRNHDSLASNRTCIPEYVANMLRMLSLLPA